MYTLCSLRIRVLRFIASLQNYRNAETFPAIRQIIPRQLKETSKSCKVYTVNREVNLNRPKLNTPKEGFSRRG